MTAEPLFRWMIERQAIYRRREHGLAAPWTTNPILQTYHFCNVFREQDRTTAWIREHWRTPFACFPMKLRLAMFVARSINYVPTLEVLTRAGWNDSFKTRLLRDTLFDLRASGVKWLTSAHVASGGTTSTEKGGVAARIVRGAEQIRVLGWSDTALEGSFREWLRVRGVGQFLAYEIATDLSQAAIHLGHPFYDHDTWARIKLGSLEGLKRLAPKTRGPVAAIPVAQRLLGLARARLRDHDPAFRQLDLRAIEDSLCEWNKYERVRLRQARRLRYYRAAA